MSWCVRATAALTLTRSSAAVAADSAITDRSARTLTPGAVVRFDRLAAVFTGLPLAGYTILTVQIIQSSSLAAARPRWPRAAGLRDARAAPGRLSSTPIFSEPAAASCPPGLPSREAPVGGGAGSRLQARLITDPPAHPPGVRKGHPDPGPRASQMRTLTAISDQAPSACSLRTHEQGSGRRGGQDRFANGTAGRGTRPPSVGPRIEPVSSALSL
jgi:hypothetical protein